MMFMIIVALAGVRLPAMGSKLFKSITISTLALCLISLFGTLFFAFAYQQKAHAWSKELQQLAPATKILVMQRKAGEIANRPFYENYMNSFHSGLHYVTTYTIENGGLGPSVFDNGPVRVRPDIPIPDYNSSTFDYPQFIKEQCQALRGNYEVSLYWGDPGAELSKQADLCFGPGINLADMTIWRIR
jgi:hypothetical protein